MAEEHFRLRILIRTPSGGLGELSTIISDWLDQNCGADRWSMTLAESRDAPSEAIAIYLSNLTCALAFLARWCLQADASGLHVLRRTPYLPHAAA